MFRNVSPIALLFVCATLSSCGGGGGGESPAPAPVPAPTPAPPPPPPTIPPLAQPPIDVSGETTFLGINHWGNNSTVNGGHGETIDGVTCGVAVQTFHIHTHLSVILNGQLLTVPANIGILGATPTFGGCFYQIHTHDGSGRLHIEAAVPVAFTLGNFFDVWGQPLTSDNVGGITGLPIVIYITENTGVTTIYQGDPRAIGLAPHRLITFQIGTPITEIPNFTWTPN